MSRKGANILAFYLRGQNTEELVPLFLKWGQYLCLNIVMKIQRKYLTYSEILTHEDISAILLTRSNKTQMHNS